MIGTSLHTLQKVIGDVVRRFGEAYPLLGGKALHEGDADFAEQLTNGAMAGGGFPIYVGLRSRDPRPTTPAEFEWLGDRDVIIRRVSAFRVPRTRCCFDNWVFLQKDGRSGEAPAGLTNLVLGGQGSRSALSRARQRLVQRHRCFLRVSSIREDRDTSGGQKPPGTTAENIHGFAFVIEEPVPTHCGLGNQDTRAYVRHGQLIREKRKLRARRVIEKRGNSSFGGQVHFGFGERDHLGNVEYVVCAGKYVSARQAVFFKLTTPTAAILMTRSYLGATGRNAQSFLKASLR